MYVNEPIIAESIACKLFDSYHKVLNDLMFILAFRNNICGTKYLCDAIMVYLSCNVDKIVFQKDIYPKVAQINNTTTQSVQKDIRHAIHVCYHFGNIKKINSFYRYPIIDLKYVPTNAELISKMAVLVKRIVSVNDNGVIELLIP